ncbi:MAG: hypothetical protein ABEJ31_08115 [Haloarculaceae archaeon]
MDEKYERGLLRISAVFVIAGLLIVPFEFVGVGPSLVLLLAFAALAAALYYAWQASDDYGLYLSGLWLGPAIAAVATAYALLAGATPGEYQAIGGVVGLLGVLNLFLRPVYRIVHYVVAGAVQIGREIQEERSS